MIAHSRIEDQRKNLVIRASASGIIRHLEGVRNGSYVHKGAPLVEIIPEDRLIVKCLVSSEDVSLVNPQQEVVYQIPSLKKLGVGPVTGKVISIAPDMILEEGLPVFEVRCSLDSLPDSPSSSGKDNDPSMGQRKYLRNGMTLIARFRLARRTVFDLLLDRKEGTQTGRL
jgi:HlyD family secretion protein